MSKIDEFIGIAKAAYRKAEGDGGTELEKGAIGGLIDLAQAVKEDLEELKKAMNDNDELIADKLVGLSQRHLQAKQPKSETVGETPPHLKDMTAP